MGVTTSTANAGATYTPIATTTLGSAAASYTFSSISSTYTDLVLVINGGLSGAGQDMSVRLNNDSSALYSYTVVIGNGSSALSNRNYGITKGYLDDSGAPTSVTGTWTVSFQNYANTTTYKTYLSRYSDAGIATNALVGLWRSTAAISSLVVAGTAGNLITGTTLTLYGIKAA